MGRATRGSSSSNPTVEKEANVEVPPVVEEEVVVDSLGLKNLTRQQKLNWKQLEGREILVTKFLDKTWLAKAGLLEGTTEMFRRAGMEGMMNIHAPTYNRNVLEFLATLTVTGRPKAESKVLVQINDQVKEITMAQIREAFGWEAPPKDSNFQFLTSMELDAFWLKVSGINLTSGGDRISSIRHPSLRIAAYVLLMNVLGRGEPNKLSQSDLKYLPAFLPGSVGFPDWAEIWVNSCIDIRTKKSGGISVGGMVARLISHLNKQCYGRAFDKFSLLDAKTLHKINMLTRPNLETPYEFKVGKGVIKLPRAGIPFGPGVDAFYLEVDFHEEGTSSPRGERRVERSKKGKRRLVEHEESVEEEEEASTSPTMEERVRSLETNVMGFMRHIDAYCVGHFTGYTSFFDPPPKDNASGSQAPGDGAHDGTLPPRKLQCIGNMKLILLII